MRHGSGEAGEDGLGGIEHQAGTGVGWDPTDRADERPELSRERCNGDHAGAVTRLMEQTMAKAHQDWDTADELSAFIRERQAAGDESWDWMPIALYELDQRTRADERERLRKEIEPLAVSIAEKVLANLRQTSAMTMASPTTIGRPSDSENLSEAEFARRVGVSVRTIKNDRKERLRQGEHYHRHGRRVLYHFPEARDFLRQLGRGVSLDGRVDVERLAIDEVTQRRARLALKKTRSG